MSALFFHRFKDHAVLLLEQLVHVLRSEFGLDGALGVRRCALADALPLDEDLRLEQKIVHTRFTLHVIDGISDLCVSIEPEDH
jgi:hypothetical protein